MKYIQLLNQRININGVAHYYPSERLTETMNAEDFSIKFIFTGGATLTLQYTKREDRDLDLKTLDFICVQNKRGEIRELKKA